MRETNPTEMQVVAAFEDAPVLEDEGLIGVIEGGKATLGTLIKAGEDGRLAALDLGKQKLGAAGAAVVARLLPAMASLTKILVSGNELGDEGTIILCDALRESTVSKVEELNLYDNEIGPNGAKAIAALCAVRGSLTKLDVRWNNYTNGIGHEGEAVLQKAVEGRSGFKLKL